MIEQQCILPALLEQKVKQFDGVYENRRRYEEMLRYSGSRQTLVDYEGADFLTYEGKPERLVSKVATVNARVLFAMYLIEKALLKELDEI